MRLYNEAFSNHPVRPFCLKDTPDFVLFHFDLYRIKTADDLYSTGFYDYEDRKGVIVAEWSDLFAECFPKNSVRVRIETLSETERKIAVEYED